MLKKFDELLAKTIDIYINALNEKMQQAMVKGDLFIFQDFPKILIENEDFRKIIDENISNANWTIEYDSEDEIKNTKLFKISCIEID